MIDIFLSIVADGLVIGGAIVMTIAIYGLFSMPDLYTRLHAASKAAVLGIIPMLVATVVTKDPLIISRAVLIAAFLILTTPVATTAIGRAAYLSGQRMMTPGAIDESGRGLPERGSERREA
ncbi:MAG: monovalent cation/H(+) antiporter subunit G [Chloroflexota bacterium]